MNFKLNYLIATFFAVLISSEIAVTSGSLDSKAPPHDTNELNHPWVKDLPNDTSHDFTERQKRDVGQDILENEFETVMRAYNFELTSQAKTSTSSILSRSGDLNGLRDLLTFRFNNLASNGLNDLSSMASKLPTTIQKCYNSYGFRFGDAITVSKMVAGKCLEKKINEARSIVQDFRSSITGAVGNVRNVKGQLEQCRSLANSYPSVAGLIAKASCLNIAIFSLRGETVLLPLQFATILGKALNSIVTIQSDMTGCSLEILNTVLDQSIQSGRAINNCINEENGNSALYTGSKTTVINTTPA